MEVYILDNLLRRTILIDRFESFIWTERFRELGDFELVINSSNENRGLLSPGTYLAMNESYRVMKIETSENTTNDEGRSMLTLKGRSLELVLMERPNRREFAAGQAVQEKATRTGLPAAIARSIFTNYVSNNTIFPADNLPFYTPGNFFPADTIPEPDQSVDIEFGIGSAYDEIKNICNLYDLGFRLVRNMDTSQLMFNIYAGSDRTTLQSTLAPVVFSPELDNLSNVTEFTSNASYKNVAYVFAKNGSRAVYLDGTPPETSGFERRILIVDAMDIETAAGTALQDELQRRGLEELAKNRSLVAFDGEIPQFGSYKYGIHYQLGDLVEMRNSDGVTNNMRVTEQIFVSDIEGERSYPTLAVNRIITPGSWLGWEANQVWADAVGYWADQ